VLSGVSPIDNSPINQPSQRLSSALIGFIMFWLKDGSTFFHLGGKFAAQPIFAKKSMNSASSPFDEQRFEE
jgi:hypothetical protein